MPIVPALAEPPSERRSALAINFEAKTNMTNSEDTYRRLCDEVWALYQAQLEKEKLRRIKRKVFLPPPPRPRRVDLLYVGIAPSPVARVGYAAQRAAAERLARDFEYVTAAGNRGASFTNDAFYDPLLQFARRIDPRFGVWPQVQRGEKVAARGIHRYPAHHDGPPRARGFAGRDEPGGR